MVSGSLPGHHHAQDLARSRHPHPWTHPRWHTLDDRLENTMSATIAANIDKPGHEYGGYDPITPEDRQTFHDQGCLFVTQAVAPDHLDRLFGVADRIYGEQVDARNIADGDTLHHLGMATKDIEFTRLLDHGPTFRYVWGLLG